MSRPSTSNPLGSGSSRPTSSLSNLEDEIRSENAVITQKFVRRFIARCRIHRLISARFEKIWDPRRQQFYYYDSVSDTSSWSRPQLLGNHDIKEVAPTYTRDEASIMIQRQLLRRVSLRRVRMLYPTVILATLDEGSNSYYYYNPRTAFTSWELPKFMGGKLTYEYDKLPKTVRWGIDGIIGDSNSDSDADDSDVSVESAVVRQRRRERRKFPRSKSQKLIDNVEDNFLTVKSLNLSNVGCSRITSRLYDMTNLTSLVLSHNQLGPRLSTNIQYLIKLQNLDISCNNIERIPKEMEELLILREFRASNNLLSTFSGYFYKLATVQTLDLSHNLFKDLPVETGNLELFKATKQWEVGIQCLKSLSILKLGHNLLEKWPTQLEKCFRLKELDLSYNSISVVPFLLGKHGVLTKLDLSFNRITEIPMELYQLPLQKLNLNNNCLQDLPRIDVVHGAKMPDLQELDLSFNRISTLDSRVGIFSSLRKFKANDNMISSIDDCIGQLSQVISIDLARNQLFEMPSGFGGCKNLVSLDLQSNKLSVLPLCMSTMRNLAHLNMRDNQIVEATAQVFGMTSAMLTIDLRNNRIQRLPMTFYTMIKLTIVDVSFNCIEGSIPKNLGQLKELQSLLMCDNCITELPESISNLTNLRILELENNKISPCLPLGISMLKKLWRLTLRNNLLEIAPTSPFHLPLLKSWDLSWNQRIVAQYIDWLDRERLHIESSDRMPAEMLSRLIASAWRSVDACKHPSAIYIASYMKNAHQEQPEGSKKVSKKAKREAAKLRKQSLVEIMSWHTSLKAHFKSHVSIYRPDSRVGSERNFGKNGTSPFASLSSLAVSTFLANQKRRVRLQLISLFRTLHLTSGRSKDPNEVVQLDSSPVPDADIVESLDLGARYQRAIEMFARAAREISAAATLNYARERQAERRVERELRRKSRVKNNSIPAMNKIVIDSTHLDAGANDSTLSARSVAPLSARSNTSEGKVLMTLAVGEMDFDDTQNESDSDGGDKIEQDYDSLPKSAYVDCKAVPFIHHYPVVRFRSPLEHRAISHALPTQNDLYSMAFNAYLGLGTALLHRVDCLTLAIRGIEKRGRVTVSLLNVAQRIGDDYEDLAADDYQDVMDRLALAEEQKGSSLIERKKMRMAALMATSGVSEKEIDIDEDDEESAKAKRDAKKQNEIQKIEKERIQRRNDAEKKKIEDEELEKQRLEEERQLLEGGGTAVSNAIDETLSNNSAKIISAFLFEHRKVTLVWVVNALDAAAELLKMRGWDPLSSEFQASRVSLIEQGSKQLGDDAMKLHMIRGRAMQLSDNNKAALDEYRSLVILGKGKFFRKEAIESIKVRLADTDYLAARSALVDFITDEVPDASRRFPEIHELLKTDRRLALLLMLANAGIDQMQRGGVWSPHLTISYKVLDNGLIVKPDSVRESELYHKRLFNVEDYSMIAEKKLKVEMENEDWIKSQDQYALKDKIHQQLRKFSIALEESKLDMQKIEQEKIAAAIASTTKRVDPRNSEKGGRGGRGKK